METKKTYKMLKTVPGSLDGITVTNFTKDEIRDDITPELAEQFYHQGAIEEVTGNPADKREKKVTGPTETKEGEPDFDVDIENIEELVTLARDTYGLEADSTMSVEDIKAMIEAAQAESTDLDEGDSDKKSKKRKK